jgi:SP family arabinose:H+ symporter-like MFS transporter
MTASAGADQPNEESVLSGLESAATTSFYWYLAVLACVGGFLFGYDTAVIGSVLVFIPYHLGSFATGYLWRERRSARRWEPWGLAF